MKILNLFHQQNKASEKTEDAALWYTKLERGLTEREREEFEQVLDADEMLLGKIEEYSTTIDSMRQLPAEVVSSFQAEVPNSSKNLLKFPQIYIGVAALLTLFLCGILAFQDNHSPLQEDPQHFTEEIAPRSHAFTYLLPDESTLRIKKDAALLIRYSSEQREVTLQDGEVFFEVQSDSTRPFIVKADGFGIQAVGTAFNVDVSGEIGVVVTEGKVSVSLPQGFQAKGKGEDSSQRTKAQIPIIRKGQTLSISPDKSDVLSAIQVRDSTSEEIENALSWKQSLLDCSGSSLMDIASEFEVKTGYRLIIADPELNHLVLGGILPSHDVDLFIQLIEKGYGIPVEKRVGKIIIGGKRND